MSHLHILPVKFLLPATQTLKLKLLHLRKTCNLLIVTIVENFGVNFRGCDRNFNFTTIFTHFQQLIIWFL